MALAIGVQALYASQSSGGIGIGYQALKGCTTGENNIGIGNSTLVAVTTGEYNTAIGADAGKVLAAGAAFNTFIGGHCGKLQSTGIYNTFIGGGNGRNTTTGSYNCLIGLGAGNNHAAATSYMHFVGQFAGYSNTSGTFNAAFGYTALYSTSTGSYNTVMGNQACYYGNNSYATALGAYSNGTGSASGSKSYNTAIGYQALYITQSTGNTALGYAAGNLQTTGNNNTFIGNGSNDTAGGATASNTIVLGNNAITTLRCNTSTISALSDARDKKNVEDIPVGLDFVNQLRPVKFDWDQRDGGRVDIPDAGFIAQEARDVVDNNDARFLNLVDDQNPEHFEMSNATLIPVLVKAIQDLSAKNDELEARLSALESGN
jgi:hypothetical protein